MDRVISQISRDPLEQTSTYRAGQVSPDDVTTVHLLVTLRLPLASARPVLLRWPLPSEPDQVGLWHAVRISNGDILGLETWGMRHGR